MCGVVTLLLCCWRSALARPLCRERLLHQVMLRYLSCVNELLQVAIRRIALKMCRKQSS
jgi:hypothetical protein